jgi:hypothetical protein
VDGRGVKGERGQTRAHANRKGAECVRFGAIHRLTLDIVKLL